MLPALIILNSGSSSVKFSLFSTSDHSALQRLVYGQMETCDDTPHFIVKNDRGEILYNQTGFNDLAVCRNGNKSNKQKELINSNSATPDLHAAALNIILSWLQKEMPQYAITAAGHRVVHGGTQFTQPILITEAVIKDLTTLIPLAPLHQPYNIAGIKALNNLIPNLVQIACFDTSFHATQPAIAQAYALPKTILPMNSSSSTLSPESKTQNQSKLSTQAHLSIKRYGFHGISYEYIAQIMPHYLGDSLAKSKTIVAHLGHGASLCAMINKMSIATTMGFSTLDGLPMGTRCGSIDPGVILYLLSAANMSVDEVTHLLYDRSGLLGVSDISADVRTLLTSSNPAAQQAIELFVYRMLREIGSLIAALSGLDNLIFTAGIGENSAVIRASVCKQLKWLGIEIDDDANSHNDVKISTDHSKVAVWVIPTNEELMIAQHVQRLLNNK